MTWAAGLSVDKSFSEMEQVMDIKRMSPPSGAWNLGLHLFSPNFSSRVFSVWLLIPRPLTLLQSLLWKECYRTSSHRGECSHNTSRWACVYTRIIAGPIRLSKWWFLWSCKCTDTLLCLSHSCVSLTFRALSSQGSNHIRFYAYLSVWSWLAHFQVTFFLELTLNGKESSITFLSRC